ncbi:MAG: response regulator transcription factor [Alphaproteobacteria bacterium]|nr:response regulator transcription factor [Alphaproteobacteria bacterium]
MSKPIKVAIIDDHPLFRDGVAASLRDAPMIDLVAEGSNASEAIEISEKVLPDIMLLDISMPGKSIEAARQISILYPAVRIIMLTASDSDEDVSASLDAGARGYVLKGIGSDELIRMIVAVHNGESYITPSLAARVLSKMQTRLATPVAEDSASLTPREEQILEFVSMGQTNKEIAKGLGISEKTVKHYMTNIMQKLQVRNRVEAVLSVRNKKNANEKRTAKVRLANSSSSRD